MRRRVTPRRMGRRPLAAIAPAAVLLALSGALVPGAAFAQSEEEARSALRSGAYEGAIGEYRRLVRARPGDAELRVELMEALVATGRYDDAVDVGRDAPNPAAVANATGEALLRLGRLDEAESA